MAKPVGIAILAYYGLDDVKASVLSVQEHCKVPYTLLVMDNSENDEVGEWVRGHAADVAYVRSPYNAGCARARCVICKWFAGRGASHFIVQDQDVTWVGDAARAMLDVFERHADTGIASWHLATKQMSPSSKDYAPDATGKVTEVPGMCCMYSVAALRAAVTRAQADGCPDCRPWNRSMFMFRFDTLMCLLVARGGFKTRVVWPDTDLVRHAHAHSGISRYPHAGREQQRSRKIFAAEVKRHHLVLPQGMGL